VPDREFRFKAVTPEGPVTEEDTRYLVVPGARGYIGVLAHHAPMVVKLRAGVVRFGRRGGDERMAVSGGFLEVHGDEATILADTAELAEDIDVHRAREAKRRAEERLESRSENVDHARARAALERAAARLRAAGADSRGG